MFEIQRTVSSFLLLLIITSIHFLTVEPCNFLNTVRFIDGEYHHNEKTGEILYKNKTYKHWNYYTEDLINGERMPANVHIRGCFCDTIQSSCIRLCCDYGYLMLPKKGCIRYDEVPFDVNIEMFNGVNVNLASLQNQFIYGKPCNNMYDDYGYESLFKFHEVGAVLYSSLLQCTDSLFSPEWISSHVT
jgi:hypothetical protein